MFKVNNGNTKTTCEICSKLAIKTQDWHHWLRPALFIVHFQQALLIALVFPVLSLNSYFLLVAFLCFQIKTLHSSICFILWFHDGLQMSDIYQKGNTLQLIVCQVFNPLHLIGLFLYPLKTSVNLWFSGVFRGYYRKRPVALNGLVSWNKSVTHCRPLFPFYTPWKHQRGRSFSVGMERKNWPEMG